MSLDILENVAISQVICAIQIKSLDHLEGVTLKDNTTRRQARASNSTTDWAARTDVDNAPIASPRQSRMITPIPAWLQDLKTAASKLALNLLSSGGCHC